MGSVWLGVLVFLALNGASDCAGKPPCSQIIKEEKCLMNKGEQNKCCFNKIKIENVRRLKT